TRIERDVAAAVDHDIGGHTADRIGPDGYARDTAAGQGDVARRGQTEVGWPGREAAETTDSCTAKAAGRATTIDSHGRRGDCLSRRLEGRRTVDAACPRIELNRAGGNVLRSDIGPDESAISQNNRADRIGPAACAAGERDSRIVRGEAAGNHLIAHRCINTREISVG